jgi:hypothetical protein
VPATLGEWALVAAAWFVGAFGCGWLLARLYKRLYPELAFYKLWAAFTAVSSGMVALLFAFGVVRF